MKVYKPPAANLLFGQFLIEKGMLDEATLFAALKVQAQERGSMKQSYRLLGTILYEDFSIFKSRLELSKLIQQFNEYKNWIEEQHSMLKNVTRKGDKNEKETD